MNRKLMGMRLARFGFQLAGVFAGFYALWLAAALVWADNVTPWYILIPAVAGAAVLSIACLGESVELENRISYTECIIERMEQKRAVNQ